MRTHVYANGLEIAAKAVGNDGVSPQAFPDPCWSPPPPSAGPVVVPYPNTCYAGAITNGTKTVFIKRKEVAIEDVSYFATSIGNEPATTAFRKGVKTGVITGKAYFVQWSQNVFFEGFGVPRHLDLVTHNHGSNPPNTPTFNYLSEANKNKCNDEKKRIERACQPEDEKSEYAKEINKKKKPLQGLLSAADLQDKKKKKLGSDKKANKWHWTDDHCAGLEVCFFEAKDIQNYVQKMQDMLKQLPEELKALLDVESQLMDMAKNAGAKAAGKVLAKAGAKQLAGSWLPLVGNAIMGIWTVVDIALSVGEVKEIKKVVAESLDQLDMMKKKIRDIGELSKKFKNFEQMTPEDLRKLMIDSQDILATLNPCTRAQKCVLVPYSQNDKGKLGETAGSGGCCFGQTGHHLIPQTMLKDSNGNSECNGYRHETAPTVCVEGPSYDAGSHKRAHDTMNKQVKDFIPNPATQCGSQGKMSVDEAIDAAANSHQEAFPASRCSKQCIKAQLEKYYKEKCPNSCFNPKTVGETGTEKTGNTNGR